MISDLEALLLQDSAGGWCTAITGILLCRLSGYEGRGGGGILRVTTIGVRHVFGPVTESSAISQP